jgi:spore maturation protein CgeB
LYLLEHPAQRGEIALAGQRRALKDHNYDLRAGDLDRIIKKELGGY